MRVVHLGAEAPDPLPPKRAEPAIATLGHVIPRKRHVDVLRALPDLPGVRWVVIGDGPELPALRALAGRAGRRRPRRRSSASSSTTPRSRELARCHVMALPSEDEAFGVAYAEALACGVPADRLRRARAGPRRSPRSARAWCSCRRATPAALRATAPIARPAGGLRTQLRQRSGARRPRRDARPTHLSWDALRPRRRVVACVRGGAAAGMTADPRPVALVTNTRARLPARAVPPARRRPRASRSSPGETPARAARRRQRGRVGPPPRGDRRPRRPRRAARRLPRRAPRRRSRSSSGRRCGTHPRTLAHRLSPQPARRDLPAAPTPSSPTARTSAPTWPSSAAATRQRLRGAAGRRRRALRPRGHARGARRRRAPARARGDDDFLLLFVGRLEHEKGIDVLVDAWLRADLAPTATLAFAGDGPLRGRRAARTRVNALGQVDRDDLPGPLRGRRRAGPAVGPNRNFHGAVGVGRERGDAPGNPRHNERCGGRRGRRTRPRRAQRAGRPAGRRRAPWRPRSRTLRARPDAARTTGRERPRGRRRLHARGLGRRDAQGARSRRS